MAQETNNGWIEAVKGDAETSRLTSAVFIILLVVPAIGTILFGAVDEITWVLFSVLWIAAVLLWLADAWRRGGLRLNTSAVLLPLLGLALIGLLQLLPISMSRSIDPQSTYFFEMRLI